ncbi:MAG TPA: hypothetical protein VKC54_02390 [Patescibacteria group bacterium]|nr:hypothetical protein [Patescibacteria group bacterium]
MTNQSMVNIGSPEAPIYVSEKSLHPETKEGSEWWNSFASGSIILTDEALDILLKKTDEKNK